MVVPKLNTKYSTILVQEIALTRCLQDDEDVILYQLRHQASMDT